MNQSTFYHQWPFKLPPRLPKRGNALSKNIGRFVLWLLGWRVTGNLPDTEKMVLIVAPHTSNWDFVIGIATYLAFGLKATWFGKHTLFRWPFGKLLTWMGGLPVKRTKSHGFVDHLVEVFEKHDKMILGLSPEGTRRKITQWKKGYYYIALGAKVPIVLVSLDFSKKELGFGPVVNPTGDYEKESEEIRAYFKSKTPKRPDLFG